MRLLPIALLALAAPAFAQSSFEPGVYADILAGRTESSSKYVDDSHDVSFGAGLGYQFSRNLAVEGYVRSLSLNPFRGLLTEPGYYPDSHYGVALVATAPVADQFSIYGRLGVGRTTMKSNRNNLGDKHDTDPMLGAGLRYDFSRNWGVELEALHLTKSSATVVSLGARFQF